MKYGQDSDGEENAITSLFFIVGGIVALVVVCVLLCVCKMCSDSSARARGDNVAPKALKELIAVVEEQNNVEWNENSLVKFKLVVKDFAIESKTNFIKCTLCQEEC